MSDLKLVVKPTVTAGIERGGEDLDFYIEASFPGSTPPKSINGLAKEWDFGNGGFNHETRTATGKVHISTYYDEFEWEGDLDDVMNLEVGYTNPKPLKEALLDPDKWNFDHKPSESPRLAFRTKIFIDGNAE